MNKKTRSPLFHITKRDALPWYKSWGIRAAAILLALIVCSIITTTMTGENPLQVYATIFNGSFGSPRKVWVLLQNIAMLLCIALAVTPAFKMRFWNIGGEGQVLAGALAAAACMICLRNTLPNALVIVCMCVSSILAGALWGFIPAYFKAKYNTNETLFTLMMNYVATQLVAYFVIVWENPKGSGQIGIINQSTEIGWFPQIGSYKYLLNILIVAVVTILMYFYLNYTKHGYEITVVGESERTARYVGIKVDKVIIRTMILSGADVPSIALSRTSAFFSASLPFSGKLGWFGKIFLSYGFLAYAAVIIAFICAYILRRTRIGLQLRAVGENPNTADAAGINVTKYKYVATCAGSMIAGLGGLYYVMDYACGVWSNNGFGDRGWLAIALVIFTVWRPNIGVFASFLFGGLYILHMFIPSGMNLAVKELYKMLPYVITILVLVIVSMQKKRENDPPASLGLSYFREER